MTNKRESRKIALMTFMNVKSDSNNRSTVFKRT